MLTWHVIQKTNMIEALHMLLWNMRTVAGVLDFCCAYKIKAYGIWDHMGRRLYTGSLLFSICLHNVVVERFSDVYVRAILLIFKTIFISFGYETTALLDYSV